MKKNIIIWIIITIALFLSSILLVLLINATEAESSTLFSKAMSNASNQQWTKEQRKEALAAASRAGSLKNNLDTYNNILIVSLILFLVCLGITLVKLVKISSKSVTIKTSTDKKTND